MASTILKQMPSSLSDFKSLKPLLKKPKYSLAYVFMFAFVFIFFLLFTSYTTPWFIQNANPSNSHVFHIDSIVSYYFLRSKFPDPFTHNSLYRSKNGVMRSMNRTSIDSNFLSIIVELNTNRNCTDQSVRPNLNTSGHDMLPSEQVKVSSNKNQKSVVCTKLIKNQTSIVDSATSMNRTAEIGTPIANANLNKNRTTIVHANRTDEEFVVCTCINQTMPVLPPQKVTVSNIIDSWNQHKLIESLVECKLYDGEWVRDESYPLYSPGSCSLIDEQFNCELNGRPDKDFMKLKWKPKGCTLPRLNGTHMLELLRGKRLVFVGDSLNRNMWESLICILKNSLKDQTKVYEASGRQSFRSEAFYSFVFQDYNCSVEFYVSPFLVQEWETSDKNGARKETLRLDIIDRSCDDYKTADFIIFNTGHWWTHEKTSTGKDYYQEGSHVYKKMNAVEAFRRALTTWGRWIDANINSSKKSIFFRGYSASHFSGGQWNSGGACDNETQPIKNKAYLSKYPKKMVVLEGVLRGMKTQVTYLNVTRITDYRKEAHPSVYRKQNQSLEEVKSSLRYQDCSHWCLPGVPDAWNELLYAELLIKLNPKRL